MNLDRENRPDATDRREKLTLILQNIGRLRNYYRDTPIKSRIGQRLHPDDRQKCRAWAWRSLTPYPEGVK